MSYAPNKQLNLPLDLWERLAGEVSHRVLTGSPQPHISAAIRDAWIVFHDSIRHDLPGDPIRDGEPTRELCIGLRLPRGVKRPNSYALRAAIEEYLALPVVERPRALMPDRRRSTR